MRVRSVFVASLMLAVPVTSLGACGGDEADAPPASPGANVDPEADGVIGGSINKAKGVGADAEERDARLEQQGGAGDGTTTPLEP